MINIALLSLNKVSFVSIDGEEDTVTVLPSSSWPYRFEKMCHGDLIVLQILLFSSLRLQVYGGLVWPLSCTVCWPPPRVTSVLLSSVSSWERIIQATIWGWLPMTIINISLHFPLINRRVFCGCEFSWKLSLSPDICTVVSATNTPDTEWTCSTSIWSAREALTSTVTTATFSQWTLALWDQRDTEARPERSNEREMMAETFRVNPLLQRLPSLLRLCWSDSRSFQKCLKPTLPIDVWRGICSSYWRA